MDIFHKTTVAVLMGGLGTRLKSENPSLPKCMVSVAGKPFFQWQLELMRWHGFKKFVFCVGHRSESVRDYFGDGSRFGVSIVYSEDGRRLLGTGGCLKNASALLSDPFLVLYGDSYMDLDYFQLLYAYRRRRYPQNAMMAVYRNADRFDKSNAAYEHGKVTDYRKGSDAPQGRMQYIDFGVAMLPLNFLDAVPGGGAADLADLYSEQVRLGRMDGFETDRRFYEIGSDRSLEEFRRHALSELVTLKPAVFFDRDGTLNQMVEELGRNLEDSPMSPEAVVFYPETIEVLRKIRRAGYRLIVITNQPAAAKAKTTLDNLFAVNRRFCELLRAEGIELDALLMCPHHPTGAVESEHKDLIGPCECRKPSPGMIVRAMERFPTDRPASLVVGDTRKDVGSARAAGIRCAFLDRASRRVRENVDDLKPDFRIQDLKGVLQALKID